MWTPEMRRRYSWTRREEGLRLTDEEWAVIEPLLPKHSKMGCLWKHGLRTIVDAIVHLLRTGCAWSAPPDWAPPRSTVYEWFRRLADGGWLETIDDGASRTQSRISIKGPFRGASCRNRRMGGIAVRQSIFKQSGIVTWC